MTFSLSFLQQQLQRIPDKYWYKICWSIISICLMAEGVIFLFRFL